MCVPIFRKSSNALTRSRKNISSPLKAYGYGKRNPIKYRIMNCIIWVLLFSSFHIHFLHLISFLIFSLRFFLSIRTLSFCPLESVLPLLALPFLFLLDSYVLTFTNAGLPYKYSVSSQMFYLSNYIISI
jgi:hypothetical protein